MECRAQHQARRRSTSERLTARRCLRDRSGGGAPRPDRPRPESATGESLGERTAQAASLIADVAALIPVPSGSLCLDEPAWAAFECLLAEAASLVVSSIGHGSGTILRELVASSLGDDPVHSLLLERAIDRLEDSRP